jgi:hypothetical protein
MLRLHLTRVAYGCSDLPALKTAIAVRADGGEVFFTTRNRPRRAGELIGGYLHLIIRHTLVARVQILRFDEAAEGRTNIVCSSELEPVVPTVRRAHQGWRYLEDKDAPAAIGAGSELADLPLDMARELGALALI